MSDTTGPTASSRQFGSFSEIVSFIWSVADLLRGDYKQADYGKVILPFTVLRRLDCVLADTRDAVWKRNETLKGSGIKEPEEILNRVSKVGFFNVSKFDFSKLKGDPNHLAANLTAYIKGVSSDARDVIERFKFAEQIGKLDESNLLFQVLSRFAEVDLHPNAVPNHVMGSIFEELIRRFSEQSNETADDDVQQKAGANAFDNFALSVKDKILDVMIERMDDNAAIVAKFMNDPEFQQIAFRELAKKIYDGAKAKTGSPPGAEWR